MKKTNGFKRMIPAMIIKLSRGLWVILTICLLAGGIDAKAEVVLQEKFSLPPDSARPWVYWEWINGNITKEGITADLEAMKRVGIGGVVIFDVEQGYPTGSVPFGSVKWHEMFMHVCHEAERLGLEVRMNNDAGWCGSGGPWITPDLSMQKIVWTETEIEGPKHFDGHLKQPETVANYYQDIYVVAFPTSTSDYRIPEIAEKSALTLGGHGGSQKNFPPAPLIYPSLSDEQVISIHKQVDLTSQFKDGQLVWDVPPGEWTVVRFGCTSTGKTNHPAPIEGCGLECDKLSKTAADVMFAGFMGKLLEYNKPAVGKVIVGTHIDSWESYTQNWTPLLRQEFLKRCGYDPYRYLPVITGRGIDSVEVSERFLWDWRQTLSDLLCENYAGHIAKLAKQNSINLTIEAYGNGLFDEIAYGGQADEPMGEFWTWPSGYQVFNSSCTAMASAGHIYGKHIIGAEAFTSDHGEKWLHHPARLKILGDWAFCEGINRFVFHRYAMQPWTNPIRVPGMTMSIWGLHYERTQTWWEQTKPWHEYLARCQYLLRQGLFVADICYLQHEGAPRTFSPPMARSGNSSDRPGYNYDGCSSDAIYTRMSVKEGLIMLPDGMNYRLLVLPEAQTMTLRLLKKIAELVEAGATVIGPRPQKSPSLIDYPACDEQVKEIADRVWGNCDGQTIKEHKYGKGRVIWGINPEEVLSASNVPQDFVAGSGLIDSVRYIHRKTDDGIDLYFVANKREQGIDGVCLFRMQGKHPEFWWPQSGRIERVVNYSEKDDITTIPLHLDEAESVFVVFRPGGQKDIDPIVDMTRNGEPLSQINHKPMRGVGGDEKAPGFSGKAFKLNKALYGVLEDSARTRDARNTVQAIVDSGEVCFEVQRMNEGGNPAPYEIKTLQLEYTLGNKPFSIRAHETAKIDLEDPLGTNRIPDVRLISDGKLQIDAWSAGKYDFTMASGRTLSCTISTIPDPQEISGSWTVQFPSNSGVPRMIMLDKLISWSKHENAGVKYFSGTATYTKKFSVSSDLFATDRVLYLDLGRVAVMTQVKVNGKDMGILWKAPYRIEITKAVHSGENTMEVAVTNLLVNRMIGDEQLPEDSDRNGDGTLKRWPDWVEQGKHSPTGRYTFSTWRPWKKDDILEESGLIGPVMLHSIARVLIQTSTN